MDELELAKIRLRLGVRAVRAPTAVPTSPGLPVPMITTTEFVLPVLCTENVTKQFGPVRALDAVSIDLRPGEVHTIIGENGAGKSTLMKVLCGLERPDSGRVMFHGKPIDLKNPADAQRRGISMIHQELNLVDDLSIADNIFLGREK